jgi:Uma2 family endonuclease
MDLILDAKKRYTYADYLTWMDDQTRELLDGFIRLMSPAPTLTHAKITRGIFFELENYIRNKLCGCQVFTAPFDVRLPKKAEEVADDEIYTVVQPDICVVCDESKLDERGCLGAPDMVVEILSLSSLRYDLNDKFNLYEASGVKEYWVVMPKEKGISVFILQDDGKYARGVVYEGETAIPVKTLPGLTLNAGMIFND